MKDPKEQAREIMAKALPEDISPPGKPEDLPHMLTGITAALTEYADHLKRAEVARDENFSAFEKELDRSKDAAAENWRLTRERDEARARLREVAERAAAFAYGRALKIDKIKNEARGLNYGDKPVPVQAVEDAVTHALAEDPKPDPVAEAERAYLSASIAESRADDSHVAAFASRDDDWPAKQEAHFMAKRKRLECWFNLRDALTEARRAKGVE